MRTHLCLAALGLAVCLDAQTIVIPDLGSQTTANSSSDYPWNRTSSSVRVQYAYDTSNFTEAASPVQTPILIERLRFRAADNAATTTTWTGGTYGGITIQMSSAAVDHASLTTTFSSNHGTDLTEVFSGSVDLAKGTGTGSGSPGAWYVEVKLTKAFPYDPTQGNDLLIDIGSNDNTWTPTSGTSAGSAVTAGGTWKATRLYDLTSHTATTGTLQGDVGLVCEISYTLQSGLFANFTATPTTGGEDLKVTFKDTSVTSDKEGIQSWAWDFDGDTKVDSTEQNPTFTYKCGKYSPSLTVTDKTNKPSTKVHKDLIQAGLVTAAFAVSGATRGPVPLEVRFTNRSTGPVTGYQWDFDGDSKVDSTEKDPTFTFTTEGVYDVKLTVVGTCDQDSDTQKGLIRAGVTSLSTLFRGGNGLTSPDAGSLFDLNVKNQDGVKIMSLDISSRALAATNVSIDVYITSGTYAGKDTKPAVWTKVSSGTAPSKGGSAGTPTPVDVTPFYLAPGKYGVYVNVLNGGIHYTTATQTNYFYSNGDLEMVNGAARSALFGGAQFSPRVWNGSICYAAKDKAASGRYGFGCPGTNKKSPSLSLSVEPTLKTDVKFDITDMVDTAKGTGVLLVGLKNTQTDLTANGMPDCALFNEALVTLGFVNDSGSGSVSSRIPKYTALVGLQFFVQSANEDKGANPLGVAASHGLAIRIGNK